MLVKHDTMQLRHAIGQFHLAILAKKVSGVRQTSGQDSLVADSNQLHVFHVHVGGREKPRQEFPFPVDDREKPLMLFHGSNQHFRRQGQIGLVKRPAKNVGTFQ